MPVSHIDTTRTLELIYALIPDVELLDHYNEQLHYELSNILLIIPLIL